MVIACTMLALWHVLAVKVWLFTSVPLQALRCTPMLAIIVHIP